MIFRERKTLAIKVEAAGKVTVIVPNQTSHEIIIEKVKSKAPWIIKKLDYFNNIEQQNKPKSFLDDDVFMYLGQDYRLRLEMISTLAKPEINIESGKVLIRTPTTDKKKLQMAMIDWYREKANEKIRERINFFQPQIPKKPNRVVIKEQKKRWGSCSSKDNLNFNWKIIMAPTSVIDYIVVHELCHLVFLNHSKEFWNILATILPDYRDRKVWLDKNGFRLSI